MKKLLASLLALMLLTVGAACAETANVAVLYNPVVTLTQGDEVNTLNLEGLEAVLAVGVPGDVPTVQFDALNGDKSLLSAEMQFTDGKVLLGVDGMSCPLYANIPAGAQADEGIKALFEQVGRLTNVKLPAFTGVNIPKIDLMSLAGMIGAQPVDENGVQTAQFEIPYEIVKSLLSMVGQYRGMLPEDMLGQVFDLIDNMVASDTGFALSGRITDDGATASLEVFFYPVEGGVTAEAAFAALLISSAENQANIAVDLYNGDQVSTLGELAVTSIPEAAELNMSFDVMGMLSITGSLYPDSGNQVAALSVNAMGQTVNMSLTYGEAQDGEGDFVEFIAEMPDQFAMDVYSQSAPAGDGGIVGLMTLAVETYGETKNGFRIDCDVSEYVDNVDFRAIKNVENAVDVQNMTEADTARMNEELSAVVANLMAGFGALQPDA